MADIGKLIVDGLYTEIVAECQTAIGDETKVVHVTRGEFQDDPEDYGVIVCIHRNDPDKTDRSGETAWLDVKDLTEMGMAIGAGGYAAVEHWRRRFTIEIIVWPGQDQATADEINGKVVNRVRQTVTRLHLQKTDEFGESIVVGINPVMKIKTNEGGGPDDEYSWKTFLYLEYRTVWNPT